MLGRIRREIGAGGRVTGFWYFIVSFGILKEGSAILGVLRDLRGTTLTNAARWSQVAAALWTVTWFADQCAGALSAPIADHAWYVCAVLSLCPPIAVLGSRRPGTRVWTWFILWPMLFVLGWPVGTLWLQGSELRGLQLESPQFAAFCLVLVMGVGNYCGTRFTISALLYGAAILAIVASSSVIAPRWLADRSLTRFWSSVLMALAMGMTKMSSRPEPKTAFDRLWFDFFDTFGIVWGRRIQDRVNFIAQKENLNIRLELDGFVFPSDPISNRAMEASSEIDSEQRSSPSIQGRLDAQRTDVRLNQILRWLLRRFVDPSWIDARLEPVALANVPVSHVDS